MSYESPEERIERLESRLKKQEKRLESILDFMHQFHSATTISLMKVGCNSIQAVAGSLKFIQVLNDGDLFTGTGRAEGSKLLSDFIVSAETKAKERELEIQTLMPPLPKNLFWKPPQNPPDNPPGPQ